MQRLVGGVRDPKVTGSLSINAAWALVASADAPTVAVSTATAVVNFWKRIGEDLSVRL